MNKMNVIFIILLLSIWFYGCAIETVILRNEKGDVVRCEASKGPVEPCIKQYEASGYKRVEPEMASHHSMY